MSLYVILALGIVGLGLLVFQALTGLHVIRFRGAVHFKIHRWTGLTLLGVGLVHATIAVGFLFFGWFA